MINNKVLGMLGLGAKAGQIVSGMDACLEAMKKKKIRLIIVSEEASDKTKKNINYYADKYQMPIYIYGKIDEISKAIGNKNKAIVGVKDENMAKKIKEIIDGGEIIG